MTVRCRSLYDRSAVAFALGPFAALALGLFGFGFVFRIFAALTL